MLKKIVLGKVQGYLFLYICHRFDYTGLITQLVLDAIVFSMCFSRSPCLVPSFFFYTLSHFHLHLPYAC